MVGNHCSNRLYPITEVLRTVGADGGVSAQVIYFDENKEQSDVFA